MKKLLCLFMSIVLLFSSVMTVYATGTATGTIGENGANVKWSYNNGVLTFTGTGRMDDLWLPEFPISKYKVKEAWVTEGITYVGGFTFYNCTLLETVIISGTVTEIGVSPFQGCTSLKKVVIPPSVTKFGIDPFGRLSVEQRKGITIYCEEGSAAHNCLKNEGTSFVFVVFNEDGSYTNPEQYKPKAFKCVDFKYSGENGFDYDDAYFDKPATSYNHKLATMSLCLALSTFRDKDNVVKIETDEDKEKNNTYKILKECGFNAEVKDIATLEITPTADSIGYALASKTIGDDTTLIVCAVRSGGYEDEWASNVTLGIQGDHNGFETASLKVVKAIRDYVASNSITGKVKIWLTGYSRGAATATQAAASLNKTGIPGIDIDKNSIYAYGFATPAGAIKDNNPTCEEYSNIFNIVHFHDVVPLVAPEDWSFGRYGTTFHLPTAETTRKIDDVEPAMVAKLNSYGLDKEDDLFWKVSTNKDGELIGTPGICSRTFIELLSTIIGDRETYSVWYEVPISDVILNGVDINKPLAASILIPVVNKIIGVSSRHKIAAASVLAYAEQVAASALTTHGTYGAYYMSWMQSLSSVNAIEYFNKGELRWFGISCPVNVYIYDSDDVLVASIVDEKVIEITDSSIVYGIDENGHKAFYLPFDGEYDIRIEAREDCKTTVTINEFDTTSATPSHIVTYTDISMESGEVVEASASENMEIKSDDGTTETKAEYTVVQNDEIIEPNYDISDNEVKNYTYVVNATCDENKGFVYGGGVFTIGEFCQVEATNKPGYKFSKWTVNGEIVSTEPTYRFAVKENVTIVAEYEVCEHPAWTTEAVAVTCTEDGYTKHTCDVCTYSYNDNIVESTGHNYQWCETVTPTTSQSGLKQYICLVCENVGRSEMLPILSGFNFVATDVSSYSLASYNGIATEVKIPSKHNNCAVTTVGSSCFKGNETITRVEIPVGVTSIGYLAFYECTALNTVSIPATVTSIGAQAFYGFNGTIICQKDSYAHQYAIENGIDYIIPTLKATNSKSFIDFENQFVFSTITKCKNIDDIIVGPPTMLTLPTASLKSNGGDFYGTGSKITMFDGNTFMGDYVLIINGDVNGDSACDALDAAQVALVTNGQKTIDGAYAMAADSNLDDEISIEDYQAIVNKVIA